MPVYHVPYVQIVPGATLNYSLGILRTMTLFKLFGRAENQHKFVVNNLFLFFCAVNDSVVHVQRDRR